MPQSNSASMKIPAHKDMTKSELARQNEILCSLDLSHNPDAETYKQALAAELVNLYENGAKGVKTDKWKAKKYSKIAKVASKSALIQDTLWRTETAYNTFGWANDTRLFAVRVVNLLAVARVGAVAAVNSVLSILGLMYAIRLVFDIALVTKAVFSPEGDEEKNLSKWERLKAVMAKDTRKFRMANDLLWFALNLAAICMSAGLSLAGLMAARTVMAVGGFAFDAIVEVIKWIDVRRHEEVLLNVQAKKQAIESNPEYIDILTQIADKQAKIALLNAVMEINKANNMPQDATVAAFENEVEELKNSATYREHAKYAHIEVQLTKKVAQVKKDRLRLIGIIFLVCVGMSLSLFPLTLPLGVVVAGAAVALIGGSFVVGLGDRIANSFKADPNANVKVEEAVNAEHNDALEQENLIAPNANKLLRQHSPAIASVTVVDVEPSQSTVEVSRKGSYSASGSPVLSGFYSPKHAVRKIEREDKENNLVLSV
ncbi:MAG: hypothetical protein P4M14_04945 [Gammaproteobacteria bacterium]|nr:hypothetical protein [Gammaproteobacteria bacterium]